MKEFSLVDQAYMDGASLHVKIFKKGKWYECHIQIRKDYKDSWYLGMLGNSKVFQYGSANFFEK